MSEPLISRVYSLQVAGFDDAISKINLLTAAFNALDNKKKELNASLQQATGSGDQTAITQLTQKIKDLETEMAKLKTQRDASAKEAAALQKNEKDNAAALLLTSKATVEVAKAEQIRAQTLIAQNADRQKQLDIEEKQRSKLQNEKEAVDALEGSYLALKNQRLSLEDLVGKATPNSTITFQDQSFTFDEAISKIKEMKVEELAFTEQLQIEKTVHDNINKSQQQEILSIQKQRIELESLVNESQKTSTFNSGGQSFTNDQAIAKITELRNQEQLLTDQLINEKSIRQSITLVEEQKLNTVRQEIVALEELISNSSQTSSISFGGQSLNFSQAIAQLQQLKTEEQDFTQKLNVEKTIQENIIVDQQQKIEGIRQQRTELENSLQTSQQTSTISFQGQTINNSDAIEKIRQLKLAEDELIKTNQSQQESSDVVSKAQARLAAAQSDTGRTVAELNVQTQLANKSNKQIALDTLGLIDEYGRLKIQYNEAATAAKNLAAVSLKTGNAGDIQAAESATAKAKALGDSLLQIETGVNQAQRNVGNYTGALKILESALGEARQKLDSMTQSERDNTTVGQNLQKEVGLLSTLAGQQSQGFISLRREVSNATQALATLEEQGLEGTPAFEQLQIEVANAKRGLIEFNNQQKLLSSEIPGISALTSVAKGLGAAYAFGAGATALFGDGNEKTAEKLNKLVAVMTLLQGLTELNRTLQERSAIATALVGLKEQALTGFLTLKNFVLTGSISLTKADTIAKEAEATATEGVSAANKIAAASFVALRTALIATGIGALLILLTASALAMSHLAESAEVARDKITVLNEVNAKAIDGYVEQKIKVDDLVAAINNSNASLDTRKDKLNELIALSPQYLNGLTLENLHTAEGVKILGDYNTALQRKAELEAAQSAQVDATKDVAKLNVVKQEIADAIAGGAKTGFNDFSKEAADFINSNKTSAGRVSFTSSLFNLDVSKSDLQQALNDVQDQINKAQNKVTASNEVFQSKLNASLSLGDAPKTIEEQYKQIETIRDKALSVENTNTAETERTRALSLTEEKTHLINVEKINVDALNQKITLLQKNKTLNDEQQKDLASLEEQRANIELETSKKIQEINKKADKPSKLDLDDSEQIKLIEANRDKLLAVENTSVNEIELVRQLSFDEEKQHLINVEKINVDALNHKIALLDKKKTLNNQEAKDLALFGEQKTTIELETAQKIDAIQKKAFDEQSKTLKKQFETQKSQIDLSLSFVLVDPNASNSDRAVAKKIADQQLLDATVDYYAALKKLAIQDKQSSEDIEEEKQKAIAERIKAGLSDDQDIYKAALKDQQEFGDQLLDILKKSAADKATAILDDASLSSLEKAKQLHQLELDEQKRYLTQQKENDANALLLLKANHATKEQIAAGELKLAQSSNALAQFVSDNETTYFKKLGDSLKNALNNVTNFFKGVKDQTAQQDLDAALATTQDILKKTINETYQAYFTNQAKQIDQDKKVADERLQIQEKQVENLSQSQAETASIQAQFAAKQKAVDEKASEEKKQLALKQAAIDFGVAVIKTLAAYPFPISLIPVAGLTLEYILQRSNIEKQQFAEGGLVRPSKINNGRINVASNIPVQPNGDDVLATVKRGEVILNEDQQRKLGGAKTFRDIGVPGFAHGGHVSPMTKAILETEHNKESLNIFSLIKGDRREIFKYIDAQREERIDIEKSRFKESLIDEVSFLKNIFVINEETANRKIYFLESDITRIQSIQKNKTEINESEIGTEQKNKIRELNTYKVEQESAVNKEITNIHYTRLTQSQEFINTSILSDIHKIQSYYQSVREEVTRSHKSAIKKKREIDFIDKIEGIEIKSRQLEAENRKIVIAHRFIDHHSGNVEEIYNKATEIHRELTSSIGATDDKQGGSSRLKNLFLIPGSFPGLITAPAAKIVYKAANSAVNDFVAIRKVDSGLIKTTENIPALANGDNILATVKKGEVILNRDQQIRLGGAKTFRAIGVPGFASGGYLDKIKEERIRAFASGGFTGLGDGPLPGSNLFPPENPSSFLSPNGKNGGAADTSKIFDAINQQTENLNALARQTNQRIDKLTVVLDPNAVKRANDKTTKAISIGKL